MKIDARSDGHYIYKIIERLFPIHRSITGEGVRESLRILQEYVPLKMVEVPTGTPVLDWTIPKEWNVKEAWIKDSSGNIIVDARSHNLHLLNYSVPFRGKLTLDELKKHLFTDPEKPDWIPYRTSYYKAYWGFCLAHTDFLNLKDGTYEVLVDTSLTDGSLTYGELFVPGKCREEFIISAHICHPSLANDNLSGVAVSTCLAREILTSNNYFSYRFIFAPGTIGAIAWLALHEEELEKIMGGLVISLLGDPDIFHYKRTRLGQRSLDQVVEYVLENSTYPFEIQEFSPFGYDERQYGSPGFNLPIGNLCRSLYGFREYHTSADNLEFVSPEELQRSHKVLRDILQIWDNNHIYRNLSPKGEPHLGKRGLYQSIGGEMNKDQLQMAFLWVLNFSDGQHTLLDIADRSKIPFMIIQKAAAILEDHGLLSMESSL